MRSYLVRRIRGALEDTEIELQRYVMLDGKQCLGAYCPERHVIQISYGACRNADEAVLTVLHEAAHVIGLPEYQVDEALDRALFRSPTLRWAAARAVLEAALELLRERR